MQEAFQSIFIQNMDEYDQVFDKIARIIEERISSEASAQKNENAPPVWLQQLSRYTTLDLYKVLNGTAIENVVDIVVYVRNEEIPFLFDWLLVWKPQIEPYNLILMIDIPDIMEFEGMVKLPEWLKYHVYTREDVGRSLGEESWIIGEDDLSMLSFGFLASDRDIVVVLSLEVYPPMDENTGKHRIHVIEEHVANLLTDSFLSYYSETDAFYGMIKGRPLVSSRGSLTGISQGVVIDGSTYENLLTTQNTKTVPKLEYFSLNIKNFAFNRKIMGPSLYFGSFANRFDLGIKTGFPPVMLRLFDDTIKPLDNNLHPLVREVKQQQIFDHLLPYFPRMEKAISNISIAIAPTDAALILSQELHQEYPVLNHNASTLLKWVKIWDARNGGMFGTVDCLNPQQHALNSFGEPCLVKLLPIAGRSSIGPKKQQSTCAIFTMVRNEAIMLPVWIRYYSRFVPAEDIWILDHHSTDGSTDRDKIPKGIHIVKLLGDESFSPHYFLNRNIELFQQRLLRAGYRCTLFAEVDEFIVPHPFVYSRGNLTSYMEQFLYSHLVTIRTNGQDVCHISQGTIEVEPDLDFHQNLLSQRSRWRGSLLFQKPILSKVPIRYMVGFHSGFHVNEELVYLDSNLILAHFHYGDKQFCIERETFKYQKARADGKEEEKEFGIVHVAKKFDSLEEAVELLCVYSLLSIGSNGEIQGPNVTANAPFPIDEIYEIPQNLREEVQI